MNILFVNRMLSMERGGGETFDLEISRHLAQAGCSISYLSGLPLLSTSTKSNVSFATDPSVSNHVVKTPYTGWFPWDKVKGGWRLRMADFYLFERAAAKWALRREGQFDIIQVCELPTFVRLYKQWGGKTPVSIRLTAPNFYDPNDGIRMADQVIASGTSVEKLKQAGIDVHNVPNGVDTALFRPGVRQTVELDDFIRDGEDFRDALSITDNATVLLYVARFQDFKNHAMLIQAFHHVRKKMPHVHLLLAGSGPLEARCKEQLASLGLSHSSRHDGGHPNNEPPAVIFLGEVPFSELPAVYRAADIKVISSDYESYCFAAIEAMATGLPVVSTDCGWVPSLLGGETTPTGVPQRTDISELPGGRLSPIRDEQRFAEAVCSLLEQPDQCKRHGAWNRSRAQEQHGWTSSADTLKSLYQKLQQRTES